jgi:outer membrane immunogenic protein
MKSHLLAGASVAVIVAAGSANSADLAVPYKAPLAPAPQFSWTGCHIGTSGGLGAGHTQWTDTQPDGNIDGNTASARTANTDMSGAVYGGQIGCDMQVNGNWVIGVGGMMSAADVTGTNQDQFNNPWTLRDRIDWFGSATGRIGWAVNSVLLYTKGGFAFAHNKFEIENSGVTLGTPSSTRIGWTLGSGVEWAFAPSWSVFAETNYYCFGNQTETFNLVPGFINPPTTINTKQTLETLTFGVNYKFF